MEENPCKGLIELGKIYSYKDLCEAVNDKYYSGDVTDCCPECMDKIMETIKSLKKA